MSYFVGASLLWRPHLIPTQTKARAPKEGQLYKLGYYLLDWLLADSMLPVL